MSDSTNFASFVAEILHSAFVYRVNVDMAISLEGRYNPSVSDFGHSVLFTSNATYTIALIKYIRFVITSLLRVN